MPFGAVVGWEAAVFDHYQAMVTAIGTKLRLGDSEEGRYVGGSTYNFWIWEGHPMEREVLCLLEELRERVGALRQRVTKHNESDPRREHEMTRVIAYVGQTLLAPERGDAEDLAAAHEPDEAAADGIRETPNTRENRRT